MGWTGVEILQVRWRSCVQEVEDKVQVKVAKCMYTYVLSTFFVFLTKGSGVGKICASPYPLVYMLQDLN